MVSFPGRLGNGSLHVIGRLAFNVDFIIIIIIVIIIIIILINVRDVCGLLGTLSVLLGGGIWWRVCPGGQQLAELFWLQWGTSR